MTEHTCHDPATEVLCRFSRELVDELGSDWHECAAFRLERVSDDEIAIVFARTLEHITSPDGEA
jgi:hypothetical protein